MWARSVTGELQVVKCSNFSVQKYGKRVSQRKGCDVELLTFECRKSAWAYSVMEFSDNLQWDRMVPFFVPPCISEVDFVRRGDMVDCLRIWWN